MSSSFSGALGNLESFHPFDPIYVAVIFLLLPLVVFVPIVISTRRKHHLSLDLAISKSLIDKAGIIFSINFCFALVLVVNQALYAAQHLDLTSDVMYYMKVDSTAYDAMGAIDQAKSDTSFNSIYRRRLSSTSEISLLYHTSDYANVFSGDTMSNICWTENSIISNVPCLDTSSPASIFSTLFDMSTCQQILPFSSIDSSELANYFDDNFDASSANPSSNIVFSSFRLGGCSDTDFSSMTDALSAAAVDGIEVNYHETTLLNSEFASIIFESIKISAIALVLSLAIFIIYTRGIVCSLVTIYSLVVCIISSAAFLPIWGYQYFSAFNVMSIFILIGVGTNAVVLFHCAWMKHIPWGEKVNDFLLFKTYSDVGYANLFTVMAACISLFSKLASPVVIISQLGAFLGLAVVIFFLQFHYLIIPMWVITNRFRFPKRCHDCCKDEDPSVGVDVEVDRAVPSAPVFSDHYEQTLSIQDREQSNQFNENVVDGYQLIQDENAVDNENNFSGSVEVFSPLESTRKWYGSKLGLFVGVVMLLVVFCGIYFVYDFTVTSFSLDFGVPQLFDMSTNIGVLIYVMKNYKSDIFSLSSTSIPVIPSPTQQPTVFPTRAPTYRFISPQPSASPTAAPTRSPTFSFGRPSASPTASPTARPTAIPTAIPTAKPTASPTQRTTSKPTLKPTSAPKYTDFVVKCCWGFDYYKSKIDGDLTIEYQPENFLSYVNYGLFNDLNVFCDYVDSNRDELNIVSSWVKERDCVYQQLIDATTDPRFVSYFGTRYDNSNILIFWSELSYDNTQLLGVDAAYRTPIPYDTHPMWICTNFSSQSEVSSFLDHPSVAQSLSNLWKDAMNKDGLRFGSKLSISVVSGSDDFTFPVLAMEVLSSIEFAILISVCGFVGLLIFFTWNAMVSLIGTIVMITSIFVTICLHIHFFDSLMDLLDIVVLVSVIGMVVDFPIHMIETYTIKRREKVDLNSSSPFPIVFSSQKHLMRSFIVPTLVCIAASYPLLNAKLLLLRKTGEYLLLVIIVSYFISVFILPFLLLLTCDNSSCFLFKKTDYDIIQNENRNSAVVEGNFIDDSAAANDDNNNVMDNSNYYYSDREEGLVPDAESSNVPLEERLLASEQLSASPTYGSPRLSLDRSSILYEPVGPVVPSPVCSTVSSVLDDQPTDVESMTR